MTEQAARTVEKSLHAVEKTAHVAETVVEVARQEGVDWQTLREAAVLTGSAVVKFVQWWLCGRGLHAWEAFEYDDGTRVEECSVCGRERDLEVTA